MVIRLCTANVVNVALLNAIFTFSCDFCFWFQTPEVQSKREAPPGHGHGKHGAGSYAGAVMVIPLK